MRRSRKPLKLLILVFLAMFALNTMVMYILFGINVFRPVEQSSLEDTVGKYGYSPYWKTSEDQEQTAVAGSETGEADGDIVENNAGNNAGNNALENAGEADNEAVYKPASETVGSGDSGATSPEDYLHLPWNTSPSGIGSENNQIYLTKAQVESLDTIDIKDKFAAVAILAKVNGSETDRIIEMAGDGITASELVKIEEILGKYLTAEEIEELKGIVDRNIQSH